MTLTTSASDRPAGRPGRRSQRSPGKPTPLRNSSSTERPRPDQLLTGRYSRLLLFLPGLLVPFSGNSSPSARRREQHRCGRAHPEPTESPGRPRRNRAEIALERSEHPMTSGAGEKNPRMSRVPWACTKPPAGRATGPGGHFESEREAARWLRGHEDMPQSQKKRKEKRQLGDDKKDGKEEKMKCCRKTMAETARPTQHSRQRLYP